MPIKSKERVIKYGEVFTPENTVNDMLNLVDAETCRIESTFFDPACGNGNFQVEILRRKLEVVKSKYAQNKDEFEHYLLVALSTIYGIEFLEDNIQECRERLFDLFYETYTQFYNDPEIEKLARIIIEKNIIHGDSMKLCTVKDKKPLIICKWKISGRELKCQNISLQELVNGQCSMLL